LKNSLSNQNDLNPPKCWPILTSAAKMASIQLEEEDHVRDAAFNKALHGDSSQASGSVGSMFAKSKQAQIGYRRILQALGW
jgi:hypothetical protein